jgi:hypothetical protein
LLVDIIEKNAVLTSRDSLAFLLRENQSLLDEEFTAEVRIKDRTYRGTIPHESFARYDAWKNNASWPETSSESDDDRIQGSVRSSDDHVTDLPSEP